VTKTRKYTKIKTATTRDTSRPRLKSRELQP